MRIIITGGTGFLGRNIRAKLLSLCREAPCVDILLTARRQDIGGFRQTPAIRFVPQDVTSPLEIDGLVNAVVHMA